VLDGYGSHVGIDQGDVGAGRQQAPIQEQEVGVQGEALGMLGGPFVREMAASVAVWAWMSAR
jgi:hypothetical protein